MNYGMKFICVAAIALLAACTTGSADYTAYDMNNDDRLDRNEFTTAYNDLGYYNTWDTDRDGRLMESEWNEGLNAYYKDYNMGTFGTFNDWDMDRDGFVSNNEFVERNYGMWDMNRDGYIEVAEFNEWSY